MEEIAYQIMSLQANDTTEAAPAMEETPDVVDTFPYHIVFGVWATWMLTFSILLLSKYVFSQTSATSSPNVYWAITAWTMAPLWFFTWTFWLVNLIVDNKGGKIHKLFSILTIGYMVLPVVF